MSCSCGPFESSRVNAFLMERHDFNASRSRSHYGSKPTVGSNFNSPDTGMKRMTSFMKLGITAGELPEITEAQVLSRYDE